jgi:hypothetical protein
MLVAPLQPATPSGTPPVKMKGNMRLEQRESMLQVVVALLHKSASKWQVAAVSQ